MSRNKRIKPEGVKWRKYKRGVYGSYGNRDLKTYQCKLPREPFEKFDRLRKKYHMCKNEILLGFIEYYNAVIAIERIDLAREKRFLNDEVMIRALEREKEKAYNKYIKPLITNGITTDLENGMSVSITDMLESLEEKELDKV